MFRFHRRCRVLSPSRLPSALAWPGPKTPKPIKVLWCTGGGFHDYKGLQPILTKAIQEALAASHHVHAFDRSQGVGQEGFCRQLRLDRPLLLPARSTGTSREARKAYRREPRQDDPRRQAGRGDPWHASLLSRTEARSRRLLRGHGADFRQARQGQGNCHQEGLGSLDRGRLAGRLEDQERRVVRERQVLRRGAAARRSDGHQCHANHVLQAKLLDLIDRGLDRWRQRPRRRHPTRPGNSGQRPRPDRPGPVLGQALLAN